MTCVATHTTALAYWATRFWRGGTPSFFSPKSLDGLSATRADADALRSHFAKEGILLLQPARGKELLEPFDDDGPSRVLHLATPGPDGKRLKACSAHKLMLPSHPHSTSSRILYPLGTYHHVEGELCVSSPEQCALEMAGILEKPYQLVEVLNLLLGTYVLSPTGNARVGSRAPLTTIARLRAYLDATPAFRHKDRLRRALDFTHEGAASPPENLNATELGLPVASYGRGFPEFALNVRHDLASPELVRALGKDHLYMDLALAGNPVRCTEWDSYEEHWSKENYDWTQARGNALRADGVIVFSLTQGQARTNRAYDAAVWAMEELFGLLHPPVTPAQRAMQHEAHDFLYQPGRRLF